MSIKSETAAHSTLQETYLVRPRFCDAIGGSLTHAFTTMDDLSGFDTLLRELDTIDDADEARN